MTPRSANLIGDGEIYSADGETFITDARYAIQVEYDRDGRQKNTGTLHDIDFGILKDMAGNSYVLKPNNNVSWNIVVRWLVPKSGPPISCNIRVNSVIDVDSLGPGGPQGGVE